MTELSSLNLLELHSGFNRKEIMELANRYRLAYLLCLSAFILCLPTLSLSAVRNTKAGASSYVRIPLLYMTDRAISDQGFLNKRKHEKNSIYEVYCGSLEYTVDNVENKILTSAQEKLGWHYENKKPKYPLEQITLDNPNSNTNSYEEFSKVIIDTAKKTGAKEFFIYLHGYNNPFAGGARSAARFAYCAECPVILYSWPSAGKILQYYTDIGNNEWSQEHFNRFLEELLAIKEKTGIEFSLFAHSMGIKLAVRAAPVVKGKELFEQLFLVNPDFDACTFVHYVSRFAADNKENLQNVAKASYMTSEIPATYCKRLRILFSSKDNALPIVQFLFGGYTRLGQGADELLERLFDKASLSSDEKAEDAKDLSEFSRKHPEEETDEEEIANLEQSGNRRAFEWIDYATLDYGWLGHSIPFKLVANLWAYDKPGDKFTLETCEHGSFNRFTHFAAWFFGIPEHVGSVGTCEKVVLQK